MSVTAHVPPKPGATIKDDEGNEIGKAVAYVKPNGTEIVINDRPETLAYAESQGWKPKK